MNTLSSGASDAHPHPRRSTPSRAAAMLLWLFFTSVTAYTLLRDVLHGAEPVTTSHVLAVAALVAALAAGHYAWPELRRARIVTGLALGLVFCAATAYVVVSAASRNAETAATKSARIADSNAARAREERQLALALDMHKAAVARLDAECVRGKASKAQCDGIRATIAVYAAAIDGHNARLDRLGPALPVNGGYAHAGRFLVALFGPSVAHSQPGLTAEKAAAHIEQRLAETMPTLVVLISELASIAFGIMAFRVAPSVAHQQPARAAPSAITEREQPFTPEELEDLKRLVRPPVGSLPCASVAHPQPRREPDNKPEFPDRSPRFSRRMRSGHPKAHSRAQAEADLVTMLALGQSVPSQESLAQRWSRPKQTVSDWLAKWQDAGLIPARQQTGRVKRLVA